VGRVTRGGVRYVAETSWYSSNDVRQRGKKTSGTGSDRGRCDVGERVFVEDGLAWGEACRIQQSILKKIGRTSQKSVKRVTKSRGKDDKGRRVLLSLLKSRERSGGDCRRFQQLIERLGRDKKTSWERVPKHRIRKTGGTQPPLFPQANLAG